MKNGRLVQVADFWTDRRPLPSRLDEGRRVRVRTVSSVNTGIPRTWEHHLGKKKGFVKNSKTCNDKSYVAHPECCVLCCYQSWKLLCLEYTQSDRRVGVATRTVVNCVWGQVVCSCGHDGNAAMTTFLNLISLSSSPPKYTGWYVCGILIPDLAEAVPGAAQLSYLCVQTCS